MSWEPEPQARREALKMVGNSLGHLIEHLGFFFFRLSVYGGISLQASESLISTRVRSLLLCTPISETSSARFLAMKSRSLPRQVHRSSFLLLILLLVWKTILVYARSYCLLLAII